MRILLILSAACAVVFGAWLADENMNNYESSDMKKKVAEYLQNCDNGSMGDCYFVAYE